MINLLGHCGRHRKLWTSTFRLSKTFQFSKPGYFLQKQLIAASTITGIRHKSSLVSSDEDEVAVAFPLKSSENLKAMHYHLSDDIASQAIDLLELTSVGVYDGKVLEFVECLARSLQDKPMRDLILLQSIEYVSRTHDDSKTAEFRRVVEKHVGIAELSSTVTSAATVWSDTYLRGVRSRTANRNSGMLEKYLGNLSDSTAASDAWFRDVERARSRLVNVLGDKVDSIELFGSSRSGLSSQSSDADMSCIISGQYSNAMINSENQLLEFDADYLRAEKDLSEFRTEATAAESLRSIIQTACTAADPDCQQPEHSYRLHLSRLDDVLDGLERKISRTEKSLQNMRYDRRDFLHDQMDASQDEVRRHNARSITDIARILRRSGYSKVNPITHARVPVIKCHEDRLNLDIDLVINKSIGGFNSDLIKDLVNLDSSGKIKDVARLLKSFVKSYDLGDASNGAISSYSWMVLLMHFFLNNEFLPPLLSVPPSTSGRNRKSLFSENFYIGHTVRSPLPSFYENRLAAVSVADLLILFTAYVTTRVDVGKSTLTLRGRGDTMCRSKWDAGTMIGRPKSWCLSIEDPFERADSVRGHDLGQSIRSIRTQDRIFQQLVRLNKALIAAHGATSEDWSSIPEDSRNPLEDLYISIRMRQPSSSLSSNADMDDNGESSNDQSYDIPDIQLKRNQAKRKRRKDLAANRRVEARALERSKRMGDGHEDVRGERPGAHEGERFQPMKMETPSEHPHLQQQGQGNVRIGVESRGFDTMRDNEQRLQQLQVGGQLKGPGGEGEGKGVEGRGEGENTGISNREAKRRAYKELRQKDKSRPRRQEDDQQKMSNNQGGQRESDQKMSNNQGGQRESDQKMSNSEGGQGDNNQQIRNDSRKERQRQTQRSRQNNQNNQGVSVESQQSRNDSMEERPRHVQPVRNDSQGAFKGDDQGSNNRQEQLGGRVVTDFGDINGYQDMSKNQKNRARRKQKMINERIE